MKLLVGLGNPGTRYKATKHNVGFWVIDGFAKQENISLNKRKFNTQWGQGKIDNVKFILAKPLTYMNLSGQSVNSLVNFFKIKLEDVLVVLDDISLKLGIIRLKHSGGFGGHRGLQSIIEYLGTEQFARLRLGIGSEEDIKSLSKYVLSPFKEKQNYAISRMMVKQARDVALCWLKRGTIFTMNRFNRRRREILDYESL